MIVHSHPSSLADDGFMRHFKFLTILGVSVLLGLAMLPAAFATPAKGITVTWSEDSTSVQVTSDKDLSNVVLKDCLGIEYKFDGLDDKEGTFEHPSGLAITTVWVKSGNNGSGDGPGYGERFDNPDHGACNELIPCEVDNTCETTTTTGQETTTTTAAETTTTTAPAATTTTLGAAPRQLARPPAPPTDVLGATDEALPRTGSTSLPLLVLVGFAAIVIGLGAMRVAHHDQR